MYARAPPHVQAREGTGKTPTKSPPTNPQENMHLEPKQPRITRTYTIEPHLYEQVKQCANKDARVVSRIIENYLTRYVQSRT